MSEPETVPTLTPTKAYVTPPNCELVGVPFDMDVDDLSVDFHMVVWNGHEFETVLADSWVKTRGPPPRRFPRVADYDNSVHEQSMLMY